MGSGLSLTCRSSVWCVVGLGVCPACEARGSVAALLESVESERRSERGDPVARDRRAVVVALQQPSAVTGVYNITPDTSSEQSGEFEQLHIAVCYAPLSGGQAPVARCERPQFLGRRASREARRGTRVAGPCVAHTYQNGAAGGAPGGEAPAVNLTHAHGTAATASTPSSTGSERGPTGRCRPVMRHAHRSG